MASANIIGPRSELNIADIDKKRRYSKMDTCETPHFTVLSFVFVSHQTEYSVFCCLSNFETTEDACQIGQKFLIFSAEYCGQQCQRP